MQVERINILVAMNNSVIGSFHDNQYTIPWPFLKEDMNNFAKITSTVAPGKTNYIIMGKNTWNTLPQSYKKNSNRQNIVLTRNPILAGLYGDNYVYIDSWESALSYIDKSENVNAIYSIGGPDIYDKTLCSKRLGNIYLTKVNCAIESKSGEKLIYFPVSTEAIDNLCDQGNLITEYSKDFEQDGISYSITKYTKSFGFHNAYMNEKQKYGLSQKPKPSSSYSVIHAKDSVKIDPSIDEYQYLELVRKIMTQGMLKQYRNGMSLSIFGASLKYDLSKGYPLMTCKRSYPKSIFEELMWFVRGQTDTHILRDKNVKIWCANSSKEFLEKRGLSYRDGDIGPGYGFQLRHFGAKYIDCDTDYTGQGVDQLQNVIDMIRNDPTSRRIRISLWNPVDTNKMALPPCHVSYTFGVDPPKKTGGKSILNCHLDQRSWDIFLGWNTTTAALLTFLLANHLGLDVGILYHTITDVHIYKSHIDCGAISTLLERHPTDPPKLSIKCVKDNIEDYEYSDLVLTGYNPGSPIRATMVA